MKIKLVGLFTIVILIFVNITAPALNIAITEDKKNIKITQEDTIHDSNQKITEIIDKINKSVVKKFYDELISIGPRMTSTYGCEKAGEYIYQNFQEFDLDAEKQKWSSFGNRYNPEFYHSENIIGTLHGNDIDDTDEIVFNAHYDTVRDSVGANDDGSGVVGVLAAAYILSQYSFDKTIKFVTFSGEEVGLLGSTFYAREAYLNNDDILIEFNADMIGRAITKEDGKKIRLSYTEDTEWIIDIMENINKSNDKLTLQISDKYPYDRNAKRGFSDYYGFIRYGYESISVWEKAGDPYANTPEDVYSNVNISYLVNTTRIIAATIAYIADIEDQPPKITISTPKKGKLYYEDRILKTYKTEKTIVLNDIWIYTDIKTYNSEIDKVEFYYDDNLEYTAEKIPYVWHLNKNSIRRHKVKTILYDKQGRTSEDQINFLYLNLLKSR